MYSWTHLCPTKIQLRCSSLYRLYYTPPNVVSQLKDSLSRKQVQTQLSQEAANGLLFLVIHFDRLQESHSLYKVPEQCPAASSTAVL